MYLIGEKFNVFVVIGSQLTVFETDIAGTGPRCSSERGVWPIASLATVTLLKNYREYCHVFML